MHYRAIFTGILLATSLLACSGSQSTAGNPVSIAYITSSECSRFCDVCRGGAREAQRDLTLISGQLVEVMILEPACPEAPEEGTTAEGPEDPCALARPQIVKLEEAIEKKVNAIVIDVQNAECETPLINQAVDAGIKVVTYGSDAASSKRHTYYGLDNKAAGAFLMDAVATLNGKKGKIAMETWFDPDGEGGYVPSRAPSFIDRVAGFNEALTKYPDMTSVATLPCIGLDSVDPFCTLQAESALEENPDITGFVFLRSKLLRELDLAKNAPQLTERAKARTIHSVAFDAQPEYFEPMRAGYVDVLLGQKLFGWGFDTVLLAYEMVTIDRQVEPFTDAGWYTVCPNNVDEFEQKIQVQGYRTPLSKCSLLP